MHIITKPVTLSTILHIITKSFAVMKLLLMGFQKKKSLISSKYTCILIWLKIIQTKDNHRLERVNQICPLRTRTLISTLGLPYLRGEENIITYFSVIKGESHLAKCKVINLNVLHSLINANLAGISRDIRPKVIFLELHTSETHNKLPKKTPLTCMKVFFYANLFTLFCFLN